MDSCRISVDLVGSITATMHTTSAGQGHETMVGTVVGEVLEIDPDKVRVVRADSLASLPSNSPVGSRMAIMLGGAAFHAAHKIRDKLIRIGAKQFQCSAEEARYAGGVVSDPGSARSIGWLDLVAIAHRNYHLLPSGLEPGLETSHVYQVPTGGALPTKDGRVHMYPCHSLEFHVVLVAIDPVIGKPEL